ncbi:divergent polysaccharide deacetylase family protein [Bacillus marasmi]|uniref:divergent polysaccharide deacetylase family protein n=1 Tax=Bacillus marasmi TaxID=1926279 RepID=UPI0011C8A16E|nr:divergent polysaccharide deacetylase family protein [Bacillus marasmi]
MKRAFLFILTLMFISMIHPANFTLATPNELKAAVIIDDFGGGVGGVKEFLEGNIKITAAVMPFTENAKAHAKWAHKNGIEVMVHLPMQPKKGKRSWLGPKPITVDLSKEEVKKRVREAIKSVPYAKGLNNHMGSLAIENEEIVRAIVEVAKENRLYLIDSGTSPNSKIPKIATELGVPFLVRDVFLDDISSSSYVSKQMRLLAKITEKNGRGIAIGHVGVTGNVCSKGVFSSMKHFGDKNIKIVPVSELIYDDFNKKYFKQLHY